MADQKPDMAKLQADLDAATAAYREAERCEAMARISEAGALNRLNAAQAAFDDAVTQLRNGAGRRSDWASSRSIGKSV